MTITESELNDLSNILEDAQQAVGVEPERAPTVAPGDTKVILPVGLWSPIDGLRDTAEVRELNGFDEEVIAKAKTIGAAMNTVLERAVVSVGGKPLEKGDVDLLTIGDRIALLIGIRRVTWGPDVDLDWHCGSCDSDVEVDVSLDDVPSRDLKDKESDRVFSVEMPSGGSAKLRFPSGKVHRQVLSGEINTGAEMTTALIVDCVQEMDGQLVINEKTAKSLSSRDRRAISDALVDKVPGPLLEDISTSCPECEAELLVSIPVGALFPG